MRARLPFLTSLWPAASLLTLLAWISCSPPETDPQRIVDRAIEAHGGAHRLDGTVIQFDFRDRRFRLQHDSGLFRYERTFPDSSVAIRDVMTNDGVWREIDGEQIDLTDSMRRSVTSGVNSVAYFALLPFKLNDPAVRKRYLGADSLKGEPYYKVEITFEKEGGGRDYSDRFIYWFHRDDHTMDFFAYDFEEDDGGTRFREAIRAREVGGLRFPDYNNYTSDLYSSPGDSIENYDDAYRSNNIRRLSEITLENISVEPIASD